MPLHDVPGPFTSRDLLSPYDVANGLNMLSGTINQANLGMGNGVTRAQAAAMTFTQPPPVIRTTGYSTAGDMGGALYARVNSQPNHPGYFQTVDGSYYEYTLENNEISIAQFGARPLPVYNIEDASVDCYPAFLAIDKMMSAKVWRGVKVIVPPFVYYTTKTINIRRVAWHLMGATGVNNSMIRAPWNVSIISICGNQGGGGGIAAGPDYSIFPVPFSNGPVRKGQALFKRLWQPNPGGLYRCMAEGVTSYLDDGLTGTDPTATYICNGTPFKYERQIGPGSDLDYDISESFNDAGGTIIENLTLWGFWRGKDVDPFPDQDLDVSGTPQYRSGVIMRSRAIIRNCHFTQFNGFGLAIVADGDRFLQGVGNVNGFDVEHAGVHYNGKAGIHIGYSDANAGSGRWIDSDHNGCCGIQDYNFLGNSWEDAQFAFDGHPDVSQQQYPGACIYNGNLWSARVPIEGNDQIPDYINEEPGIVYLRGGNPVAPWISIFGTNTNDVGGVITGSISGTTLTVTAVASGAVGTNNMIATRTYTITTGRVIAGTRIVSQLTGTTGGVGTYQVDRSQTVTSMDMNVMLVNTSAIFTGSISGTTLTATAIASGTLGYLTTIMTLDDAITSGRVIEETTILAQLTGPTGGIGTYTVNKSQTVTSMDMRGMSYVFRFGPPWTPTKRFEPAAMYASSNVNAVNVWKYMYQESGTAGAQPGPKDLVLGGPHNPDLSRGVVAHTYGAISRLNVLANYGPLDGGGGRSMAAQIASPHPSDPTIFKFSNWDSQFKSFRYTGGIGVDGTVGPDIIFGPPNTDDPQYNYLKFIDGGNGLAAYGRSNPIGGATWVNKLVVGDGGGGGRLWGYVNSPPSPLYPTPGAANFGGGEVLLMKFESGFPTSGQAWGWIWIPTSAGNGYWLPMGTIP